VIIWVNGAFGSGKTTIAYELNKRIPNSFVYDPEKAGYFIRGNMPKEILKDDFQNHISWRKFNLTVLQEICSAYSGTVIVPMTIVNPQYFNEIISELRLSGIEVHHFTLVANRETLLRRLRSRGDFKDSWPAKQIDRCISNLSLEMFKIHIDTDKLTVEEIIAQIAGEIQVELASDSRGIIKKKIDRLVVKLKHVRI